MDDAFDINRNDRIEVWSMPGEVCISVENRTERVQITLTPQQAADLADSLRNREREALFGQRQK